MTESTVAASAAAAAAVASSSSSPRDASPLSPGGSSGSLITKFTNVSFLRGHTLVVDDLWVRGSRIIDPQERFWEAASARAFAADRVVDGAGLILAPGYIDLQLNGAFGFDFSNPADMAPASNPGETDKITQICQGVLRHGVTSIYATIITSSPSTYEQLRPLVKKRQGSAQAGAHILGLHLEGPFITVPGAHPPALLRNRHAAHSAQLITSASPAIDPAAATTTTHSAAAVPAASDSSPSSDSGSLLSEVESVYGRSMLLSDTSIVTLAPEIPGIGEVIRVLSSAPYNIVVSSGHSNASFEQAVLAADQGARLITHLFNAMTSFHHRDPGLIGLIGSKEATAPVKSIIATPTATAAASKTSSAAAARGAHMTLSDGHSHSLTTPPPPGLFYSLIVDGHHTHPASVKIAWSTHPSGAVLITDAMLAMGLQDGKYRFGEIAVEISNNMAHVDGTNTLAGSIATMEQCVQNFHSFTGCSLVEAIEAATLHPAQCMRLGSKGSLDVGMDADLILLDRNLKVQACWVMGEMAWKNEAMDITVTEVTAATAANSTSRSN